MSTQIDMLAVGVADITGIALMIMVLIGKRWKSHFRNIKTGMLLAMIVFTMLGCLMDMVGFAADGKSGLFAYFWVRIANFWVYADGLIIGSVWTMLISWHVEGKFSAIIRRYIMAMDAFGFLLLVINMARPIIYSIDESNTYHRGSLYMVYFAIDIIFMLIGIFIYLRAKRKGGILKFFPLAQFFTPMVVGIVLQTVIYGISTMWRSLSMAVCGLILSLQNENIYIDKLTGLYNRFYLDDIRSLFGNHRHMVITAMMLDMNGFKYINDSFGHSEGDYALVSAANIFRCAVGDYGAVIRFAGDEFVILLNSDDEKIVNGVIEKIMSGLKRFNDEEGKEYELSVSIGYSAIDIAAENEDTVLREIDEKMYADKKKFYDTHKEYERRNKHLKNDFSSI